MRFTALSYSASCCLNAIYTRFDVILEDYAKPFELLTDEITMDTLWELQSIYLQLIAESVFE